MFEEQQRAEKKSKWMTHRAGFGFRTLFIQILFLCSTKLKLKIILIWVFSSFHIFILFFWCICLPFANFSLKYDASYWWRAMRVGINKGKTKPVRELQMFFFCVSQLDNINQKVLQEIRDEDHQPESLINNTETYSRFTAFIPPFFHHIWLWIKN